MDQKTKVQNFIRELLAGGVSDSIVENLSRADTVEHAVELLEFDRDEINKVINGLNNLQK